MKYSQKDINNFKRINIILGIVSILIIIFWSVRIGGGLLAIALVAYFAPFKTDL